MTPPSRLRKGGILAAVVAALAAAAAAATVKQRSDAADRAQLDTFPTFTVRDTTGAMVPELTLAEGDSAVLCLLARNRYTGKVHIFADKDATDADVADAARMCQKAAFAFESERDQ